MRCNQQTPEEKKAFLKKTEDILRNILFNLSETSPKEIKELAMELYPWDIAEHNAIREILKYSQDDDVIDKALSVYKWEKASQYQIKSFFTWSKVKEKVVKEAIKFYPWDDEEEILDIIRKVENMTSYGNKEVIEKAKTMLINK